MILSLQIVQNLSCVAGKKSAVTQFSLYFVFFCQTTAIMHLKYIAKSSMETHIVLHSREFQLSKDELCVVYLELALCTFTCSLLSQLGKWRKL